MVYSNRAADTQGEVGWDMERLNGETSSGKINIDVSMAGRGPFRVAEVVDSLDSCELLVAREVPISHLVTNKPYKAEAASNLFSAITDCNKILWLIVEWIGSRPSGRAEANDIKRPDALSRLRKDFRLQQSQSAIFSRAAIQR